MSQRLPWGRGCCLCCTVVREFIWEANSHFLLDSLYVSPAHSPAREGGLEPRSVLRGGEPAWTMNESAWKSRDKVPVRVLPLVSA